MESLDQLPTTKEGTVLRHSYKIKDELRGLRNVGAMTRGDLHILGVNTVEQLAQQDATELYKRLQLLTGLSIDPCQHDVMLAVVHEAKTGEARDWWTFTETRKQQEA